MQKILLFTLYLSILLNANKSPLSMKNLYLKNACNSCHGMYGQGMGASPRLQGIKEEVLLARLQELQKGKTRSAFGTIMVSFAKALDEEQTKAMAKYLSTLKTIIADERYEIEYAPEGDGGS